MNIEIVNGRVVVDAVRHVIEHPDVHVFEIDLDSKYPGQPQWMLNRAGDGMDVFLAPTVRTRDVNESTQQDTWIRFTGFDAEQFTGIAEATRRTARVAFYRNPVN